MVCMTMEAFINLKREHAPTLSSLCFITELECKEVKENCSYDLHLFVGYSLPQQILGLACMT